MSRISAKCNKFGNYTINVNNNIDLDSYLNLLE